MRGSRARVKVCRARRRGCRFNRRVSLEEDRVDVSCCSAICVRWTYSFAEIHVRWSSNRIGMAPAVQVVARRAQDRLLELLALSHIVGRRAGEETLVGTWARPDWPQGWCPVDSFGRCRGAALQSPPGRRLARAAWVVREQQFRPSHADGLRARPAFVGEPARRPVATRWPCYMPSNASISRHRPMPRRARQ